MNLELSHDLLAQEIFARFSEEEKALRKASRMLREAHGFHQEQQAKGQEGRLLSRAEVGYISPFLDLLDATQPEQDYIDASVEQIQAEEEREKRELRAKLRRQRNVVIASLAGVIIAGGLSLVAFGQKQLADENAAIAKQNEQQAETALQNLKTETAKRTAANYRENLEAGKTLMAQSEYEAAINKFTVALGFDSTGVEADSLLAVCQQQTGVKQRYEALMASGSQALQRNDNLSALRAFRQAAALSFDQGEAAAQALTAEARLEIDFTRYVEGGDKLAKAGACQAAITQYRKALQIKPNRPDLEQKIRDCQ